MSKKANIKLDSSALAELMKLTGEATGKKAVEAAMIYFIKEARQRDILKFLKQPKFTKSFDPIALRNSER